VRGDLICGRDVFIDELRFGRGAREAVEVGPACVLKNAHIGAGSRLAAFSHIEDAIVGPTGDRPFALRPARNSPSASRRQLGRTEEQQAGRPVEANHSYRDAIIGSRVNRRRHHHL
jgi:bifunctional UDP-N-acetylglucosamine pyrophosphorylase/glucosamine-1-phosphate N-acetyltransferase